MDSGRMEWKKKSQLLLPQTECEGVEDRTAHAKKLLGSPASTGVWALQGGYWVRWCKGLGEGEGAWS